MSKTNPGPVEETHYGDHSVIVPPHRLKGAVIVTSEPGEIAMDAIEKAEAALAALKDEFSGWMDSEADRLEAARQAVHHAGASAPTLKHGHDLGCGDEIRRVMARLFARGLGGEPLEHRQQMIDLFP
jgi:hypothetical protein